MPGAESDGDRSCRRDAADNMAMKIADIAEFKNHSANTSRPRRNGEEVGVRKRNMPLARVVPIRRADRNRTVLGGQGSVVAKSDLTAPRIPDAWGMPGEERS
jgi:antitoxin (DNA-binding transcriptional repressor) of toxin-antitoxin stability system